MNKNLVFDLGMHLAQDTGYYLSQGYTVVGIDASLEMINNAKEKFKEAYKKSQLLLLNYAMSDIDGEQVDFYLSNKSEWNSLDAFIATRQGNHSEIVKVPTIKLSTIIQEYGVPYYCKIDVEGYDHVCIKTLTEVKEIPKYISCETECFFEGQYVTEDLVLATLNRLKEAGYTKFKLIDQETLKPLYPDKPFYLASTRNNYLMRGLNKILHPFNIYIAKVEWRQILSNKYRYPFSFGSTGPFGENAPGKWMNYQTARDCLLFHRDQFFKKKANNPIYTIWCDWHATY